MAEIGCLGIVIVWISFFFVACFSSMSTWSADTVITRERYTAFSTALFLLIRACSRARGASWGCAEASRLTCSLYRRNVNISIMAAIANTIMRRLGARMLAGKYEYVLNTCSFGCHVHRLRLVMAAPTEWQWHLRTRSKCCMLHNLFSCARFF